MANRASAFLRPLHPRDPHEEHRSATPLELFTDLCFVVAIAQAATGLHHAISEDHLLEGLGGFLSVFFAIWWAWLNFTWFASAYDNDDVPYRLLTMLQVLGSLVLAAGVPDAFDADYQTVVIGYVIMRVALVAQWLRASRGDPERASVTHTYALLVGLVQVAWVARLALQGTAGWIAFGALVAAELAVPAVAERRGTTTPWHPYHVAERYGLFTIIVLGEVVLSTTIAIQLSTAELSAGVISLIAGAVLTVFGMWWLYFAKDAGDVLTGMDVAFGWGYGHYVVYASAAAVGSGLAARLDYWNHHTEASELLTAGSVTVPVAVFLASVWLVHLRLHSTGPAHRTQFAVAVVLVLGCSFTPLPELLTGLVVAGLVAVATWTAGSEHTTTLRS